MKSNVKRLVRTWARRDLLAMAVALPLGSATLRARALSLRLADITVTFTPATAARRVS